MAAIGTVTVKVEPDLTALRKATPEEITAVLAVYVCGDRGPFADHPDALSVCSRAAADLCDRFYILPRTEGNTHD